MLEGEYRTDNPGVSYLRFTIDVPMSELLNRGDGGSIMKTLNVEGQRFDVTIIPLGPWTERDVHG